MCSKWRAEQDRTWDTLHKGRKVLLAVISLIKRTAVALHLMPRTMKGKDLLKRIFFGSLDPMPGEIREGMCEYVSLEPVFPDKPVKDYKVIYAVARVG